jgi:hypothetical protein
MKDDQGSK